MFYKNIWGVSGKNVAKNAAADSGYHSDEDKKKNAFVSRKAGGFDSDGGKNSKTEGIHKTHRFFKNALFFEKKTPHGRNKNYNRNKNRNKSVNRIFERCGRGVPKNKVADNSAADGGYGSENRYSENIHFFRKTDHCAGSGKSDCSDYFEEEQKIF